MSDILLFYTNGFEENDNSNYFIEHWSTGVCLSIPRRGIVYPETRYWGR